METTNEKPAVEALLPLLVVTPDAAPRRRVIPWRWLLVLLVVALAVVVWLASRPAEQAVTLRLPEGNVASQAVPGVVMGLGKLIPRGRVVTIATPFGAGDARIADLLVREGDTVAAGALLAVLDSAVTLRAALAVAEATVLAREALLAQTIVMVTTGRDDARAALLRAEIALRTTRRDLERATTLNARGDTTEQALDQRRQAFEQAAQDVARATAAQARYDGPDIAVQADVAAARANVVAAVAERDRARAELDKSMIWAPSRGTVLTLHAWPGERPGALGVMSFGDLADMVAEIEVYENEAAALALGGAASLVAVALPGPLAGRISRLGAEVMRQTLTDASPAANTDTRVIRVIVDLDAASATVAARLVNLQVTARFSRAVK